MSQKSSKISDIYGADPDFSLSDFLSKNDISIPNFKKTNFTVENSITENKNYTQFMKNGSNSTQHKLKTISNISNRINHLDHKAKKIEEPDDIKQFRPKILQGEDLEDLIARQKDDPAYSINNNPEFNIYDNITKMEIMKRKEYEYRLFLDNNRAKIQRKRELKKKREAEMAERRRKKEEEDKIRKEKLKKKLESIMSQYESFKEKTRLADVLWKISEQYELLKIKMATNIKMVRISLILAIFLLVIIFLKARAGTSTGGSNFNLGQFINVIKLKLFQQHKWKTWSVIILIVAFILLEFIQKVNDQFDEYYERYTNFRDRLHYKIHPEDDLENLEKDEDDDDWSDIEGENLSLIKRLMEEIQHEHEINETENEHGKNSTKAPMIQLCDDLESDLDSTNAPFRIVTDKTKSKISISHSDHNNLSLARSSIRASMVKGSKSHASITSLGITNSQMSMHSINYETNPNMAHVVDATEDCIKAKIQQEKTEKKDMKLFYTIVVIGIIVALILLYAINTTSNFGL